MVEVCVCVWGGGGGVVWWWGGGGGGEERESLLCSMSALKTALLGFCLFVMHDVKRKCQKPIGKGLAMSGCLGTGSLLQGRPTAGSHPSHTDMKPFPYFAAISGSLGYDPARHSTQNLVV